MGKHSSCCKYCGLEFTEETKHLFSLETHKLKGGLVGTHYRKGRCLKCSFLKFNERYQDNNNYLITIKQNTPCKDCNRKYPYYVMQFDHLYDKHFNIASNKCLNIEILKAEISKCEIVCANCHAERTFRRKLNKDLAK